jgi:hypothetical protein
MRLLVIEGAFHLRGRGLLLWPLVRFDALPPPQISFRRTVTLRQTVSHRSRQAFFQIGRIGAHADLPRPCRACLGFSQVALT